MDSLGDRFHGGFDPRGRHALNLSLPRFVVQEIDWQIRRLHTLDNRRNRRRRRRI
jgi:hypothetical protein